MVALEVPEALLVEDLQSIKAELVEQAERAVRSIGPEAMVRQLGVLLFFGDLREPAIQDIEEVHILELEGLEQVYKAQGKTQISQAERDSPQEQEGAEGDPSQALLKVEELGCTERFILSSGSHDHRRSQCY